jgi:hypothetical protein
VGKYVKTYENVKPESSKVVCEGRVGVSCRQAAKPLLGSGFEFKSEASQQTVSRAYVCSPDGG